ncbi:MAG: exostosin family protein [Planctomycetota bacterium]
MPDQLRVYLVAAEPHPRPCPLAVAASAYDEQTEARFDQRYQAYLADDRFRSVSDPADADFISNGRDYTLARVSDEAHRLVNETGKPGIFFDISDNHLPSPPIDGIVYRHGLLASRALSHERSWPGLALDLTQAGGGFDPFPHEQRPRVAFCGLVLPAMQRIWLQVRGKKSTTSQWLRAKVVSAARNATEIDTDFIIRDRYQGKPVFRDPTLQVRQDFLQNMADSPYALCVRGYGNYSVRFFEAFAAGRVPVLVDTDCVLPFADEIPYASRCVIVPIDDLANIGKHIAAFHAKHEQASFAKLQRANRETWERWFAPPVMLHRCVERALSEVACTR